MNGFVVIDKPAGITSHDVVSRVRRILGTRRVGHTGTLDPFATGVLPVAVNEGTKAIPFLDEGLKRYEAVLRLGVTTDTLDTTGRVLREADFSSITGESLEASLTRFTGVISQIPPMYSAIKQGGQPLYRLARQGREVERAPRQVEIRSLEMLSFAPPLVSMRVLCSRGTYVRTLADDIGTLLGCGAALQELRRTASGPFVISEAVTIDQLDGAAREGRAEALCLAPWSALAHLADIPLTDAGLAKVRQGRSPEWGDTNVAQPCACDAPMLVRLSREKRLVAVAEIAPASAADPRIVLKRVFICD
ncbi:MAG: tRNA pseudouridine(55) synthase TruB [Deltaproteobacteria bacterium]|nr:tRNA pseudouridine(55) synthase TruB [Deltaproteobacteria bacterium]